MHQVFLTDNLFDSLQSLPNKDLGRVFKTIQQIKKDPSIVWNQPPKLETKRLPIFLYNAILNI